MGRFFEPTLHEQGIFSGCFRGCLTWAGCLFGADLRIWDDSFLSVVEMQFFLINYVCIIITMLPKIVIMIQYFLSLTWAGYVFCIIRSRPYISGSSFPDLGRTSRLLAYLVNPPRCMFTAAAAAAAMWVLNKHESDARLSQREIERYEITHEPFLWLIWILVTLCSKSNSWFQWDQSINA